MKQRICFVFQNPASFVETDRRILAESYEVSPFEYHGKRDVPRLARAVCSSDLTFSWFALGHATAAVRLSRWLRKRSVVVTGGWDVAAMPEIPYGAMLGPSRRHMTRWTLANADLVLAVSESNRSEALQWVSREIPVVPLGVDTEFFLSGGPKENLVVTVAGVTHGAALRTKGLDTFIEVARNMPRLRFVIVGRHSPEWEAKLLAMAPPNIVFTGWLERESLRSLYQKAKVYAQFSAHESFGLSVAEAMACGCTPVVSNRGGLLELVGPIGATVPYGDPGAASQAVEEAMHSGVNTAARERIVESFSLTRRRERLLQLVEALT